MAFIVIAAHGLAERGLSWWWVALFAALSTFPGADLAVALVNRLTTVLVPATPLPALALRGSVPAELRTQIVLLVILQAEQAAMMVDAITRTVWRLFVTRRNLLEWTTSAQAGSGRMPDVAGQYRHMAGTVASSECRIDAIAQSWAVMSGAADPARWRP